MFFVLSGLCPGRSLMLKHLSLWRTAGTSSAAAGLVLRLTMSSRMPWISAGVLAGPSLPSCWLLLSSGVAGSALCSGVRDPPSILTGLLSSLHRQHSNILGQTKPNQTKPNQKGCNWTAPVEPVQHAWLGAASIHGWTSDQSFKSVNCVASNHQNFVIPRNSGLKATSGTSSYYHHPAVIPSARAHQMFPLVM